MLSTRELVNCYFPPQLYRNALEVLADPEAVVFVEGWTTENIESGRVTGIEVIDFRLAPEFSEEVYRCALGSMPDFTGVQETTDYIREVRGEQRREICVGFTVSRSRAPMPFTWHPHSR